MSLLDHFECLLALTNIAATAKPELKHYMVTQLFDSYLDNFIISEDSKIRKATWELIANLSTEVPLLVKFLTGMPKLPESDSAYRCNCFNQGSEFTGNHCYFLVAFYRY